MLRFASIGTSDIVERFAQAITHTDEACYQVACSRDQRRAEQFAREHGAVRANSRFDELADSVDVDAVYIASPNTYHHDQAAALLQAGKHVLVEKSACATAAEWRHLVELADEHGVVVLESVRAVHDPSWRMISAYLDSLGPIRQVELHLAQRSRRYDNFLAGRVENIFKPEMAAGALMDLGVYCLHPLMTLFGRPTRVQASSVMLRNGIDGATSLLLDHPGFLSTVNCSKISANRLPSVICGEDASLTIDAIDHPTRLGVIFSGKDREELVVERKRPQQSYVLDAFARMVAEPQLARVHQQATLDALEVMDEARRQVGLVFPNDHRQGFTSLEAST